MNKEELMVEYCDSCQNKQKCFPEMYEPNLNPAIVNDLPFVRRCKMEFDRLVKGLEVSE